MISGEHDQAQAAYQAVMTEPTYTAWSFGSVVTDRLQNLDAALALYSNASTTDDPPAAWRAANQCALCHTQ